MRDFSALHEQTTTWVIQKYSNAEHLVKTEGWLLRLKPDASEALILAALTHDMERAFPGPDSPRQHPSARASDPAYNLAHSQRSARIVAAFLREQEADSALVDEVAELIRAHEYGGWPEANLLQAADSLSFLEVNVALFLRWLAQPARGLAPEHIRDKFDWMYERIQIAEARVLATPLYEAALRQLAEQSQ